MVGAALSLPAINLGTVPVFAGSIAAISMLYLGGMAINDAGDVTFDRANNSTRPVAAGRISATRAAAVGCVLLLAGFLSAVLIGRLGGSAGSGSLIAAAALTTMIVLYDITHRTSAIAAAALMAGCRGCIPVLTALLMASHVSPAVWWASGGLAAWTIGITCLGRGERGGERRVPGGIIWLVAAAIAIPCVGWASPTNSTGAVAAALLIMLLAWTPAIYRRLKAGNRTAAVCWAIAGLAVLDSAMLLAGGHPGWSATSMVLAALTLGAQRLGGGS
jgi:hypothetical protein